MAKLHEVLEEIRARPGIILGRQSVHTLSAFLSGLYAHWDIGDTSAFCWLSAFGDWVRKRYGVQSSQGWAQIIAFYSLDEGEELNLFWKLYDKYREKHPTNGQNKKQRGGRKAQPEVMS
jgi:hypothetical protein